MPEVVYFLPRFSVLLEVLDCPQTRILMNDQAICQAFSLEERVLSQCPALLHQGTPAVCLSLQLLPVDVPREITHRA